MNAHAEQINTRIGSVLAEKFRLLRLLGTGGMGAVYEAENLWTHRRVAIKLMLGEFARDNQAATRFFREAQIATRIGHPNIVDVLDMAQDPTDGALYIVQELLDGGDLRDLLDREARLAPREALEIAVPIMAALVAAHEAGVVHRDLKPENIYLARTPAGAVVPKLIDFGISKTMEIQQEQLSLTQTGAMLGTPEYMSPEQARGERKIDAQSDVWSIGAVLYEMLAGRCPFVADNYNALMVQILSEPLSRLNVLRPSIPIALADVVGRSLERDKARRYGSMRDFLRALLECSALRDDPWHQALVGTYRAAAGLGSGAQGVPADVASPSSSPPPPDLEITPLADPRPSAPDSLGDGPTSVYKPLDLAALDVVARGTTIVDPVAVVPEPSPRVVVDSLPPDAAARGRTPSGPGHVSHVSRVSRTSVPAVSAAPPPPPSPPAPPSPPQPPPQPPAQPPPPPPPPLVALLLPPPSTPASAVAISPPPPPSMPQPLSAGRPASVPALSAEPLSFAPPPGFGALAVSTAASGPAAIAATQVVWSDAPEVEPRRPWWILSIALLGLLGAGVYLAAYYRHTGGLPRLAAPSGSTSGASGSTASHAAALGPTSRTHSHTIDPPPVPVHVVPHGTTHHSYPRDPTTHHGTHAGHTSGALHGGADAGDSPAAPSWN